MSVIERTYAEVMLNTAKEAASRVLSAERRAAAAELGVCAAKDNAVTTLLRLKTIMDTKIKEAEMQSLGHVKRINELEAQLLEARSTIKTLKTELEKVCGASEPGKPLVGTLTETTTHDLITSTGNECTATGKNALDSDVCPLLALESVENKHDDKPEVESLVLASKEPELYRNGCTQRIRALERSHVTADLPFDQCVDLCARSEVATDCRIAKSPMTAEEKFSLHTIGDIYEMSICSQRKRRNYSRTCGFITSTVSTELKKIPSHGSFSEVDLKISRPADMSSLCAGMHIEQDDVDGADQHASVLHSVPFRKRKRTSGSKPSKTRKPSSTSTAGTCRSPTADSPKIYCEEKEVNCLARNENESCNLPSCSRGSAAIFTLNKQIGFSGEESPVCQDSIRSFHDDKHTSSPVMQKTVFEPDEGNQCSSNSTGPMHSHEDGGSRCIKYSRRKKKTESLYDKRVNANSLSANPIAESPRSSRQLIQIAHQLIALSTGRC